MPAEVVAPDHPINEATALECVAPLQTIVRSARPHSSPRQAACPKGRCKMARISPALMLKVVGTFAWLLVGAMARQGAAQEPAPAAAASSVNDIISAVEETDQPPVPPFDLSAWTGRTDVNPYSQVILESICGKPDPDTWRPLPCSTLFSEGWLEPWVPSPNGSGGAPDRAGSMPRTATCTGCGSSRSARRSTRARRATPTSVPTRSTRRSAVACS